MTMRTTWGRIAACFSVAAMATLALQVRASDFKETIWTAPLNSFATQCAVTNASDAELRVLIRIVDALGRTESGDTPMPVIQQISTDEVVQDADGFPILELDVTLPPGGSDGIYRDRLPAGSIQPPTSCQVQAERAGVTRVSYCELLSDRCMQAP